MKRLISAAALAMCSGELLGQVAYDFTLVNAILPNAAETYLFDINDNGLAIGTTLGTTPIGTSYVGFSWSPAAGPVQHDLNWPRGINNGATAVASGVVRNVVTGQTWTLPLLPGTYIVPYPGDINDAGVAVGMVQTCNCSNSGGALQIPYVWDAVNGARTISVPGAKGLSRINANNVAIGWVGGNSQPDSFVVDLSTGQYTMMSTVVPDTGPGSVKVYDINDSGVVVGTRAGTGEVYFYGYIYSPVTGAQLLPLPGAPYQQAFTPSALNNAGQIAGQVYILGSPRSCVYDAQHGFRDLNDNAVVAGIPAGFVLMYTSRINNNGWIVGYGLDGTGRYRSFLLRPRSTGSCYANCDGSTRTPVLSANDFQCFMNTFAAGAASANCDGSTSPPVLTANDFQCFLNSFAAGCS